MARGHSGLPRAERRVLRKSELIQRLRAIDSTARHRNRVLDLETKLRVAIDGHAESLPPDDSRFEKFSTSPFVLMMHCRKARYTRVGQIERDILPAKLFSSMETSAGRMIETVTLPAYGWETVPSAMHSANSMLDGQRLDRGVLCLATLKSGPRCLNDEMSENFADNIVTHYRQWASVAGVSRIEFSYGVLYGTQRRSNKKDWHILRNVAEKLGSSAMTQLPAGRWTCGFKKNGITVDVSIRIGADWWSYLGGSDACLVQLCTALIRACVRPGDEDEPGHKYTISDLADIVSTKSVPSQFNVSLLQRSQLPWLFFLASHFCDDLVE